MIMQKTGLRQKMHRPESENEKVFQQNRLTIHAGILGRHRCATPITAFSLLVNHHATERTCNQHSVRFENEQDPTGASPVSDVA